MKTHISKTFQLILALPAHLLLCHCAFHEVIPGGDSLTTSNGDAYYLPRLQVTASVPIKKVEVSEAAFAYYSKTLLGIPGKFGGGDVTYSIVEKDVELQFSGVRDPDHRYVALYPKGAFNTYSRTMTRNNQGVLSSSNVTVKNRSAEYAVAALGAAANIAASGIRASSADDGAEITDPAIETAGLVGLDDLVKYLNTNNKFKNDKVDKLDKAGLEVGLIILLNDSPGTRTAALTKELEKDWERDIEQANNENEKDRLASLKNKQALIRDAFQTWREFAEEQPEAYADITKATKAYKKMVQLEKLIPDARSYELAKKFEQDRDNLANQFVGKVERETTWVGQFAWVPPSRADDVQSGKFTVSRALLLVDAGAGIKWMNEKPLKGPSPDFLNGGKATGTTYSVELICTSAVPKETAQWANAARSPDHKGGRKGWRYRVPAEGTLRVKVGSRDIASVPVQVGQHGCVAFTPATYGSVELASTIELDPLTGGLLKTTSGATAIDPSVITGAAASVTTVIDADTARQKARAGTDDELDALERRAKELELQKKIRILEAEAGSNE